MSLIENVEQQQQKQQHFHYHSKLVGDVAALRASGYNGQWVSECSSSRKVSHEWLATIWENNRTNNRNNAPGPKTITAANNEENYKLMRAATLLKLVLQSGQIFT